MQAVDDTGAQSPWLPWILMVVAAAGIAHFSTRSHLPRRGPYPEEVPWPPPPRTIQSNTRPETGSRCHPSSPTATKIVSAGPERRLTGLARRVHRRRP